MNSSDIYSEEVERAVLSTIVTYCDEQIGIQPAILNAVPKIMSDLFYNQEHVQIMRAIKRLWPDKIKTVNIATSLRGKVSEPRIIEILANQNASIASFGSYLTWLKIYKFRRVSYECAKEIQIGAVNDDPNRIFTGIKHIQNIHKLLMSGTEGDGYIKKALELLSGKTKFILTAYPQLTAKNFMFSRKEISSIGGKSGHHKTAFSIDNAIRSIELGLVNKVHYVSIEHPSEAIGARVIGREFNVPYGDILMGKTVLESADVEKVMMQKYGNSFVVTDSAISLQQVVDSMRANKADQHIIDHAQEILYPNGDMVGGISQLLLEVKSVAREQDANVLLLSQVKDKDINERQNDVESPKKYPRIPKSHDFYNSSRIKQESRQQAVIYWHYLDLHEEEDALAQNVFNDILFKWYKNTYAGVGQVDFKISPETGRFA